MNYARTLGPVVMAIAVLTSFVAISSASAAQFKSNSSPVMLFGKSGYYSFGIEGTPAPCDNVNLEVTSMATPANTVKGVNAAYEGCTQWGWDTWNVNMGNCTFSLLQPGNETANKAFEGNVAISCSGASTMNLNWSVFGSECSLSIGESGNTNLPGAHYWNNQPSAGKVTVNMNVSGITGMANKDNGFCALNGIGETKKISFSSQFTLEGTEGIGFSVG